MFVLAVVLANAGCAVDVPEVDPLSFSGIDRDSVDLGAKPCDDFYQFACGGFLEVTHVAGSGSFFARIDQAYFDNQQIESQIVQGRSGAAGALVSTYGNSCLGASQAQDRAPLDDLITAIDGMATLDDLAPILSKLHDAGGSALFRVDVGKDAVRGGAQQAFVGPAEIGLDAEDYLQPTGASLLAAYTDHINQLTAFVGIGPAANPDAVIRVETSLAKLIAPEDKLEAQGKGNYEPTKVSDLEAGAPHFPWKAYWAAEQAPAFSSAIVLKGFPATLEALLVHTAPADLKAYLEFRTLEAFAGTLPDGVVAEEYRFHQGVLEGGSSMPPPRSTYCLDAVPDDLPWPLSQAFVAAAFPDDRAKAAADLMQGARAAFALRLRAASWIDAATLAKAEVKAAAMRTETGAPSAWPSTAGLALDRDSFLVSRTAARTFARRASIAQIGQVVDDPWFLPPFIFNAAYEPTLNAVDVTAAFLAAPAFDPSFDPIVNAGATGAVMGHEMTHGFDRTGSQYDPQGLLHPWWSAATEKSFLARTDCLVNQYDAFEVAPGHLVDGKLTVNENIADLGGIHVAYDLMLPVGADAKAFFIAYAQHFCEADDLPYIEHEITVDPHAPAKARVNLVLQNMGEFATAFSCAPGTPMAPSDRCTVW